MKHVDFWRGTHVLVGGGCGFLGSYLVPLLLELDARVTVVDNLQNEGQGRHTPAREYAFVRGDLRDRATCERVMSGVDVFINLAANASGVGFSRSHHGEMLIDNTLCGLVPLQAAAASGVQRVVVTSSSCVYPDSAPVPTPEETAFTGDPEPVNEGYGWAKRVQELAAGYLAKERDLPITILRPFNMYGANYPWRSGDKAHVIPSIVKRVLDGEDPLVVWGSGEQRRNFLHGHDAAEVIVRVIASGTAGAVNIGYEDDVRIADLVTMICDVIGRSPAIVFDRTKPDGAARKAADATRLRALTGNFKPRVSLRQGIEEMVTWYKRTFGRDAGSMPAITS
jgi:nucleoside-diphosphate-sugar epimerase